MGTGLPHPRDILAMFQAGLRAREKPSPSHEMNHSGSMRVHASLTVAGAAQAFHLFPVSPGFMTKPDT